jgi:peptidoglycan/LPS O-acetylase OafA/YrhL
MSVLAASERVTVSTARTRAGFTHQPALDGIRGLSVLLVLLFHGGWSWFRGGYVGVSVFFTLSGFLITRLLLLEHATHGRINVVRFWGRRMRRLLPASMVCLIGVGLFGAAGAFGDVPGLGHDLVGAVLQIANWFQLGGDASYAQQVVGAGARSPLDHYWSLAIEEQFYWLWPLALVAILRTRNPDRIIYRLTAGSIVLAPMIALGWGSNAAYWATPARAGEILVGAALATLLSRPSPPAALLGLPSLAVIVWAATRWPADGGPAYRGMLPLLAIASAGLILAVQVQSPLRRAFSFRPLVDLGVISYGVYLYHWPVFMLLDGHTPGGRLVSFVTKVAVTVAFAAGSYRWIERPIRRGVARRRHLAPAFAGGAVVVLVVAGYGSFASADRFAQPEDAVSQLEPVTSLEELAPDAPATTTPVPDTTEPVPGSASSGAVFDDTIPPGSTAASVPDATVPVSAPAEAMPAAAVVPDVAVAMVPTRPVRVLVVGDSTAWALGDGLAEWAELHPELASVSLTVGPGCGFILGGHVPEDDGSGYAERCSSLLQTDMMSAIVDLQPDVVLLMAARTDIKDREWDPAEGPISNLDPRFQERQAADYRNLTDWVLGAGVQKVVWVKPLVVRPAPAPADEAADPTRVAALQALIEGTVAGSDPARVASIDLAGWYATSGMDDPSSRVDGIHFEVPAATTVAERLVGPSLVNFALS